MYYWITSSDALTLSGILMLEVNLHFFIFWVAQSVVILHDSTYCSGEVFYLKVHMKKVDLWASFPTLQILTR